MAIDSYIASITSEHIDKPNFIAWLSSSLNIVDGVYNLISNMDNDFDIDNAIGIQLDMLGTIIGRNRTLNFQPLNGSDPILDDTDYKLVLRAKIAMNNWQGTIPQMYEIWDNIFDDIHLQIEDNQNMSFIAYIIGYVDQARQNLIQHQYIVPKPEGVSVTYVGKTPVAFTPYAGMIVSSGEVESINMSHSPIENIDFGVYSAITIKGISTITTNMSHSNIETINFGVHPAITISGISTITINEE